MSIITKTYEGMEVDFTDEAWFNATAVAKRFGKNPADWLRQSDTAEYVAALAKRAGNDGFLTEFNKIKGLKGESAAARTRLMKLVKATGFIKTKAGAPENGGGTWMHPRLGVAFARWLDIDFAIWCDEQIDGLLRGDAKDWKLARHEAASSFKVMTDAILYTRSEAGKASAPYHFSNEARLVNWALSGEFKGLDRDGLEKHELDLLAKLEVRNTVLIATGMKYEDRKHKLYSYVQAWKAANPGTRLLEVA